MFSDDVRDEIWASVSQKCVFKMACRNEHIDRTLLDKGKISPDRLWPLVLRKNAQGTASFLIASTDKDNLKDMLVRSTNKKRYAIAKIVLEGLSPQLHSWEGRVTILKAFVVTFKRGKSLEHMTDLLLVLAQAYQRYSCEPIGNAIDENTVTDILANAILPVIDCIKVLKQLDIPLSKRVDCNILDRVLKTDDREAFDVIKQQCSCLGMPKGTMYVHYVPDLAFLIIMQTWYPLIHGTSISRLCTVPEAKEYHLDLMKLLPDAYIVTTLCDLFYRKDWTGMKDLMNLKSEFVPPKRCLSQIDIMQIPFEIDVLKWKSLCTPESIRQAYFDDLYKNHRQQILEAVDDSQIPKMIMHLCDVKDWQAVMQLTKRRPIIDIVLFRAIRQCDPPNLIYDKLLELVNLIDLSKLVLMFSDEKDWQAIMQMANRCHDVEMRIVRAVSFRKPPDLVMDTLLRDRQTVRLADCYQPQLREAFLKSLVNDPGCHTPEDYSDSVLDFIRAVNRNNIPMKALPDIALLFAAQVGARVQAHAVFEAFSPEPKDLERYLDMAASWKQTEMAELFIRHGAPISRYARDKSRAYGWKLLD